MKVFDKSKNGTLNNIFLKSRGRLILWISILIFIFIISFLISGYYSAYKESSFLPLNNPTNLGYLLSDSKLIEIKSQNFKLLVDQNGKINIKTHTGELILSGLTFYSKYQGKKESYGLNNVRVQLLNDSTILINGTNGQNVTVNLSLITHKQSSKLDVLIKTVYNSTTLVEREAIVAVFDVPATEVYLKNRKVDRDNFEPEYWLNKEGVRFGSNERSALIYHTSDISSLQLKTAENLLFINLDYILDHPYGIVPFPKSNHENLIDQSAANFTEGTVRNNSFSLNLGSLPAITPRLMAVPDGFLAGYIFTEHADGGNIQTHRAVYFGSEQVVNASDAIGGFVKHKIPVTKSVFYIDSTGSKGSAIFEKQNDSLLMIFLDQLNATGIYDICLHTPENSNSNRSVLEESIRFMKNRYNTITWIDHGFFYGVINREAFVAEGLDSNSIYYAADLWKKYDTRYFWSPQIEFNRIASHVSIKANIKKFKFYRAYVNLWKNFFSPRELREMNPLQAIKELIRRFPNEYESNSLLPSKGDSYPTPLYWQNPTRTNNFYSWATDFVQKFDFHSRNVVENENIALKKLVNDWGIFISHGYYVQNDDSEMIIKDNKGNFIINHYFDKILELIAQKRDEGELYTTTVRDLLNYWIKLDNVSFEYLPNGEIDIINKNNEPIKGLSIALRTDHIKIEGKTLSNKKVGDDSIFWFDINANETVRLKFID